MIPKSVPASVWLALSASSGSSHMIMSFPRPYNYDIQPYVQVNPLDGHQLPFPCQSLNQYEQAQTVEAGGATMVQFTGGAQHGGGSCQFSISYDDPTESGWNASARFKAVYTIIGGCPAHFTDESHNLAPATPDSEGRANTAKCGNDYGVDCTRQFLVPLPPFLRNGPATFAWTWFNKVGNREMYMNCAPVNITGGTSDPQAFNSLPDIFIANIPDSPDVSTCVTGTSTDHIVLNIPNPGINGRIIEDPGTPDVKPSNYCSQIPDASILPSFVSDSRTIQNGASDTSPATAVSSGSVVINNGQETTIVQTTRVMTKVVTVTDYVATVTTTVAPLLSSNKPEPTLSESPNNGATCQTEGAIVCIDKETWGVCNWGSAVPQKVSPGTECVDGQIVPVSRR